MVWEEEAGLGSIKLEPVRRWVSRARRVAIRPEVEVLVVEFAARARVAAVVSIVLVALSQRRRAKLLGSRTR